MKPNLCFSDDFFQHPVLNRAEERELLEKAVADRQSGIQDSPARTALVLHNLRWAARVAKRYLYRGLDFDDLVLEAVCGLLLAIDHYDLQYSNRFSTYAKYWIVEKLESAVAYQGHTVCIPSHILENMKALRAFSLKFQHTHSRLPLFEEIREYFQCSVGHARELNRTLRHPTTIHFSNGESVLSKRLADTQSASPIRNAIREEQKRAIAKALRYLPARCKRIIQSRYLNNPQLTLQEIAEREGVTRERIRQIEAKALQQLKNYLSPELVEC